MNSGLIKFLVAVRARAYPRIWGMTRYPMWILIEAFVPLVTMAAFVYLYKAMHAPEEYTGFLILGAVLTPFWYNVVWYMATQLHWERREGTLQLFVIAPVSLMAILVGMSVGGFVQALLRSLVIGILGGFLFQVHVVWSGLPMAMLTFFVMLVALYGLGMTLSSLFLRWGRESWQLALALHEPVFFLTGLNFPLSQLFGSVPGFIAFLSALIPISFGLDAVRQLLFPGKIHGVFSVPTEIGILAVLGVLFLWTAVVALRRMEYSARVEASLALRME